MQTIDPHSRPEYDDWLRTGPSQDSLTTHSQDYPVDAIVSSVASLVFVTTGQLAVDALDEIPGDVALTPIVALRITELLRVTLQYPDLGARQRIARLWQDEESPHVPHGRVVVEESCVRFGIEPIGAGALVAILWHHVPAAILHIEHFAQAHRHVD